MAAALHELGRLLPQQAEHETGATDALPAELRRDIQEVEA